MKVTVNKNGTTTISGISDAGMKMLSKILFTANSRCFKEYDEDLGWYSGDDFVCCLEDAEKKALSKLEAII